MCVLYKDVYLHWPLSNGSTVNMHSCALNLMKKKKKKAQTENG